MFVVIFTGLSCRKIKSNPPPDPVACFTISKRMQTIGEAIHFSNCSENFNTSRWDFGDGTQSIEINPTHTYSRLGSYMVSLEASNVAISSISKKVLVASSVQIDFMVLLKNFSGVVLSNPLTCVFSIINSNNQEQILYSTASQSIPTSSYVIKNDLSGLFTAQNPDITYRFKIQLKSGANVRDPYQSDVIDLVESAAISTVNAKLAICDMDYNITLRYQ
jgi:PKD repeat protein